jgi:hypothetical protein
MKLLPEIFAHRIGVMPPATAKSQLQWKLKTKGIQIQVTKASAH